MASSLAALVALQPLSWNLWADLAQLLGYDFMRSALLAGTVLALTAGAVGYFVVVRAQVFAGDTLSHMAFTGAMGAALVGVNVFVGLFVVTLGGAVGLNLLGSRSQPRTRDVTTGILLAWVLGVGALFLGIYVANPGTGSSANTALGAGILFGSIFGVGAQGAVAVAIVGGATTLALLAIARPLLFASVDPDVAVARGLPVRLLGAVFFVLVGVTVALAVPAVGALLVFALLVTPAATVRLLVQRPYLALLLSALLAVLLMQGGLFAAFYLPYPVSFDITMLGFLCYLAALGWRSLRARRATRVPRATTRNLSSGPRCGSRADPGIS